jgi:hypothetical protein
MWHGSGVSRAPQYGGGCPPRDTPHRPLSCPHGPRG